MLGHKAIASLFRRQSFSKSEARQTKVFKLEASNELEFRDLMSFVIRGETVLCKRLGHS